LGDTLSLLARVTDNYERKGHRFAVLDVVIRAGSRAIAEVTHVAIYRPRPVAANS